MRILAYMLAFSSLLASSFAASTLGIFLGRGIDPTLPLIGTVAGVTVSCAAIAYLHFTHAAARRAAIRRELGLPRDARGRFLARKPLASVVREHDTARLARLDFGFLPRACKHGVSACDACGTMPTTRRVPLGSDEARAIVQARMRHLGLSTTH